MNTSRGILATTATTTTTSTFVDINRQYTERKYNELNAILQDTDQWREFQDLLHGSTNGITNSSVKENLLTMLRNKKSLSIQKNSTNTSQKKLVSTPTHNDNHQPSSLSSFKKNNNLVISRRELYNVQNRELSIPSICTSSSDSSYSSSDENDSY